MEGLGAEGFEGGIWKDGNGADALGAVCSTLYAPDEWCSLYEHKVLFGVVAEEGLSWGRV